MFSIGESVKISFISLTCENFHACVCLHVYFFFFIVQFVMALAF
ncbi:putative membrane protein [Helicobacter pylori Hp H-41]|nr:putative membrane protein [Helicobacter pylori Hp H-41]